MLKKFLTGMLGKPSIPASNSDRLELARLVFNYRLERDTPCREYFLSMGATAEDFSLEELLSFQDGLLIKLTEQHLTHMDQFFTIKHGMSKADFAASHISMINAAHYQMALQGGYEIPIDPSLRTIQAYIAHFFNNMPEKIAHPFPHHLIPPCVELVTRFYMR